MVVLGVFHCNYFFFIEKTSEVKYLFANGELSVRLTNYVGAVQALVHVLFLFLQVILKAEGKRNFHF